MSEKCSLGDCEPRKRHMSEFTQVPNPTAVHIVTIFFWELGHLIRQWMATFIGFPDYPTLYCQERKFCQCGQAIKPNIYVSRRHQEMNQKWHLVCSGKIKNFCRAFLDGHPVKILKLSYQDMNQKCKTNQRQSYSFPSRFDTDMHPEIQPEMQPAFGFPSTHKKSRLVHIRATSWRV